MSLIINTNTIATQTRNYLATNQTNLQRSLGRLASGSRIVKPSDDAGGLAVGNKLTATLNRNTRAQQNVSNSISFLQVQDGALASVGKILDRMSELKTMSLDVTKNALDIANYDAEFNQLQDQLSNIREEKFNGINLFTTSSDPLTTYTTEVGKGAVTTAAVAQVDTVTITAGSAGAAEVTAVAQVDTVTITGGSANPGVNTVDFAIGADNVTVDHTGDNATTATALANAINSDGTLSGVVTADASAADGSLTLTAVTAGTAFTGSTTVAGDATNTASTTTANVAAVAGNNLLNIDIDGNTLATSIASTGDDATTATALANAINADGTLSALVTADASANDGTLTLTAVTAGTGFTATSSVADATDASTSDAATTANVAEVRDGPAVDLTRHSIFDSTAGGSGIVTAASVDLTDSSLAASQNLADYSVDDFVSFIQNAATARAGNGAQMSRLEQSLALLTTNHANIEGARSRLMDVDIATESTHFAKHNILVQSSAAMLAQANAIPNVALQLLG